jgi:hypothetical protein
MGISYNAGGGQWKTGAEPQPEAISPYVNALSTHKMFGGIFAPKAKTLPTTVPAPLETPPVSSQSGGVSRRAQARYSSTDATIATPNLTTVPQSELVSLLGGG